MKLHFRGIEVPALGSPRDLVYREYLLYEAKLEAKRHQLLLLTTMGAPFITDANDRREWDGQAKDVFDQFVSLLFGYENVSIRSSKKMQEDMMREFYEVRVKPSRPKLHKNQDGSVSVTDLPKL